MGIGRNFDSRIERPRHRVPAVVKDNISSVIAVDIHAQLSPR